MGGGVAAGWGRGGALCCCRAMTGGSLANTSLRIAKKSRTLDFFLQAASVIPKHSNDVRGTLTSQYSAHPTKYG